MPDPIYIAWAANGHIRKWDRQPFEIDGVPAMEYVPASSAAERIEWNTDGSLDEIVTMGGAHLEHMGGKRWFLNCRRADGSALAIWLTGKIDMVEERAATSISFARPDGRPGAELVGREADIWLDGWRTGMDRAEAVVEHEIAAYPSTDYAAHIERALAVIRTAAEAACDEVHSCPDDDNAAATVEVIERIRRAAARQEGRG